MQEMTRKFNDVNVVENLYSFMGDAKRDYLPHGVTENEFWERLNPEELEEIQKDIVYSMIRRKTFYDARVLKKWQVIIDATELDEGYQKKNDYYLSRCYNRGEANEFKKYHRSMLEAKLYLGNDLVCSIASEPIQNSEEYINQSEEKIKQDCESKAFIRLAEKIKQRFPRLLIIITADGLYVSRKVIQTCIDYGWDYIIRYKEGCASSIAKEPLSDRADSRFYQAAVGIFLSEEKGDKKLQKNISPELLVSFGRRLTKPEDIKVELHKAVLNWLNYSKEGDACQEEEQKFIHIFLKEEGVPLLMWITQKNGEKMCKEGVSSKWQAMKSIYLSMLSFLPWSGQKCKKQLS